MLTIDEAEPLHGLTSFSKIERDNAVSSLEKMLDRFDADELGLALYFYTNCWNNYKPSVLVLIICKLNFHIYRMLNSGR